MKIELNLTQMDLVSLLIEEYAEQHSRGNKEDYKELVAAGEIIKKEYYNSLNAMQRGDH